MTRDALDAELEIREAHCKKLEALIQLKERRLEALRHAGAARDSDTASNFACVRASQDSLSGTIASGIESNTQ